ncbi:FtsB family cell division protein [Pseudonocardia abyssalis]|nr:septum formation initiator family protein [Pseudonocardia abyssalis]
MPEERTRTRRTARPAGTGTGAARRRTREPQLTKVRSRAGTVVAATTGMLGVSSTRRAAVLAIVVCALALTVAVPLRNYVAQQQELAAVTEQQEALAAEVDELSRESARLSDPAVTAAEARSRLGYVAPGETPYVVQLPVDPTTEVVADPFRDEPWYRRLWRDTTEGPA